MSDNWTLGEWVPTPLALRLLGKPAFRRLRTLDFYHVFSEWEYSAAPCVGAA